MQPGFGQKLGVLEKEEGEIGAESRAKAIYLGAYTATETPGIEHPRKLAPAD